jgi:putative tricarboxylic transport membrane protein
MNIVFITALIAVVIGIVLGFTLKTLKLPASLGMSLLLPLCFVLKPETLLLILIVTAICCSVAYSTREANFRVLAVALLSVLAVILLRAFALNFDKAQFLALSVLCITAVICFEASKISFSNWNSKKNPRFLSLYLSIMSAMAGLIIPTIGIDVGTGVQRYSMGISELFGGIDFVVVVLGLCCVGELLYVVSERSQQKVSYNTDDTITYSQTKLELLNTCKPAEYLLAGTLGLPLSQASAIIVGAFALYGIQYPDPLQSILPHIGIAYIAALVLVIFIVFMYVIPAALTKMKAIFKIAHTPVAFYPIFIVAAFVGAYSLNYRLFDMFLLITFGLLGFFMRRLSFPIAPLIVCASFGSRMEEAYRAPFSWSYPTVIFYLFSLIILFIYIVKALKTDSNSSSNASFNDVRD